MLFKNDSKTERIIWLPFWNKGSVLLFGVFAYLNSDYLSSFKVRCVSYALCMPSCLPQGMAHNRCTGNVCGKNEWMSYSIPSPSAFPSLTVSWTYFPSPHCLACPSLLSTCKFSLSFKIQLLSLWSPSFKTELDGTDPFSLVLPCNLV